MERISIHDLVRVVDYLEQINDPRRTEYGNIRPRGALVEWEEKSEKSLWISN